MSRKYRTHVRALRASLLWLFGLGGGLGATATASAQAAPIMSSPASGTCTDADLVRSAIITATSSEGVARRVADNAFAQEGTIWNAPEAVRLLSTSAQLNIDLRSVQSVRYFVLQGDDNDSYSIEGSEDGRNFQMIWTIPPATTGQGLRTRNAVLPQPATARFLRVRGVGGDSYYSLSEFRASCAKPKVWPPKLVLPPELKLTEVFTDPMKAWRAIDNDGMVKVKGWAAVVGTLFMLMFLWQSAPRWWVITRNIGLASSGLFAFLAWWNLLHYHFDHYEHVWEHYHYYMGAKYAPELRFARLYECTAAADMADGLRSRVVKRAMRDLAETNELGTTKAIVADPKRCTSHFTPDRWNEFRADLRFFRGRFSRDRWDESQGDHGYNGTPVWGLLGRALADFGGPLDWEKIRHIAWIDSGLLVLMWIVVWWSFGWQSMCAALLYWGYNFPARFYWNGGSMLRYDWMFWMVIGVCLLRRKWHFTAGFALTYAALLRVFPGFLVVALILKALLRMVRERRFVMSPGHTRFAAGAVVTLALLVPASSWSTNGLDAWVEFAHNSRKHLHTALTNNMGLKTALGFDYRTSAKHMRNNSLSDPFREWKDAREHYYNKRAPILYALLLLFCVMLARASDREPDWAAAALGAGLIVFASELTCYYYGFLLTYGLLWERRKTPAILATALAGVTCLMSLLIDWNDEHFAAMSIATVICIVLVTYQSAFGPAVPHDEDPELQPKDVAKSGSEKDAELPLDGAPVFQSRTT